MPAPEFPTGAPEPPDSPAPSPGSGPLSQAGFEQLYRKLASELLAYVERLIARSDGRIDRSEAEDICQSAFVKLLEALPDFEPKGPESFGKFLWTIAYHLFCDRLERGKRAALPLAPRPSDGSASSTGLERGDPKAPSWASPAKALKSTWEALQLALSDLDEKKRELITAVIIDGRPYAEIASEIGSTPEAVRKATQRALKEYIDAYEKRFGSHH